MKRCKGVVSLDYALDSNIIYPLVFQTTDDLWVLTDVCESGKLIEKSKKRKRGA